MSYLAGARLRRTALVVSVAVLAALLAPVAASAGVATTPTITAPAGGANVVSSPLLVTADSGAPFVRFVVAGQLERTVAVSLGSAATEIPVHGLLGSVSIEAYDCESLSSCGVDAASITVDVQLSPPEITEPSPDDVVGNSVTVKAKTIWSGALRFFVDGSPVGKVLGTTMKFTKEISLKERKDGDHVLSVQQCSSDGTICDGATDSVQVLKDTKGPRFTDVDSSLGTVFPIKDNYKDSVKLSARVAEKSLETKVELRKAGGPLVRTLNLGREDAGRLSVTWNGRKSNGDVVPKGKYQYRFVGTDVNGVVGKSGDKVVYVSDKKLVKKRVTRTLSAWGSKKDQFVGSCSSLTRVGSSTVGLRSNSKRQCTGRPSVVLTLHKLHVGKAIKYGSLRISTFGGRAQTRTGVALMYNVQKDGDLGPRTALRRSSKWYTGDQVNLSDYLIRGSVFWTVATANGFWYDVQAFRVTYTVSVLR